MKIQSRVLVSYDEHCPYECKHCYTYGIERDIIRTSDEIVDSLSDSTFDIVYVSQKNDNFAVPEQGIELCEKLFNKYHCNIFAITRNIFDDTQLERVIKLANRMKKEGKNFFIAVSIPALESSSITENSSKVPSPTERIEFIQRLYEKNIMTIAMIRPLYPNHIIPLNEIYQIIDDCSNNVHCIVSGGLGINEDILNRLEMDLNDFTYTNAPYLQGAIDCEIKFVDVAFEMQSVSEKCKDLGIPFFEHSMPALNYLAESS